MSEPTEQQRPTLPDPLALATLAAQSRFSSLTSTEAAAQALALFSECEMLILAKSAEQSQAILSTQNVSQTAVPTPQSWPGSLNDFYRLILDCKNKADAQPRFKEFLKYGIANSIKERKYLA